MAISYFGADTQQKYILNNIREQVINKDSILLVTDYGSWVVLNEKEYTLLKSDNVLPISLFELLKQNGLILTIDNIDQIVHDYREKQAYLFLGPSLHIITPTSRCNQNCIYCHAKTKYPNSKNPDMDEETAKKIVEFIFQTPSPSIKIEFQGGEPLLNFDVVKFIINHAEETNKHYKKKLNFAISTNLTAMNNDILEFLMKHCVSITTSLDGPDFIHNKNRFYYSKQNTHADVVKWIKEIKNKYPIEAIPVITKDSLPYHKEIIDEYINLGLNLIWVQPIRKIGNAVKNWNQIGYDAEKFFDFWKKSLEYILKLNKEGKQIKEISTNIILKKILKKSCVNFCSLQSPCGAIVSQLAYNEKGHIYVCDDARQDPLFKLGDVKKDSYEEVMPSEKAQNFVKSSINDNLLCDACVWKPFCGICPVCNYSEQGNIIPKLPLSNRCKINKKMFGYVFKKLLMDKEAKNTFLKWINAPGIV